MQHQTQLLGYKPAACRTNENKWSDTSENVRFSPGSLCMSDIPSMMVSGGTETDSVADTFSLSLFANIALLVFIILPSQLARDHGIGPRLDWNVSYAAFPICWAYIEDHSSHHSRPLYHLQVRQDHLVSQRKDLSRCFLINQWLSERLTHLFYCELIKDRGDSALSSAGQWCYEVASDMCYGILHLHSTSERICRFQACSQSLQLFDQL